MPAISDAAGKTPDVTAARNPDSALIRSSLNGPAQAGKIAPGARVAGPALRFAANIRGEQKDHVGVAARAERDGDQRGAAAEFGHHRRWDHFAFDGEGAGVLQTTEAVP